jgi:hypothetical protein
MKGYQKSKAKKGLDPKTANKTNYELGTYNSKYITFLTNFLKSREAINEKKGNAPFVSCFVPLS